VPSITGRQEGVRRDGFAGGKRTTDHGTDGTHTTDADARPRHRLPRPRGPAGRRDAERPEASSTSSTPATSCPSEPIEQGEEDAERIALDAAGAGASVTSVEEGDVEGRPVFRFDVTVDGEQREITVDRVNGEVVTNEVVD
jgi:uncharacterized membrane protein YkoI